jgi:hypothetical protein
VGVLHRARPDDTGRRRLVRSRARRSCDAHHLRVPRRRQARHTLGERGDGHTDHGHRDHAARGRPHAGQGVVERMAVIGQRITHAEENVAARPTLASEADGSASGPGATVLTIARTYYTAERPVETADIVIPVERYSLVCEVPVG